METEPNTGLPRPKSVDINAVQHHHTRPHHHSSPSQPGGAAAQAATTPTPAASTMMSSTVADSIHPPQIVTLTMSHCEEFEPGESSTSAFPDSPLSSPPDSPRSDVSHNDEDERNGEIAADSNKEREVIDVGTIEVGAIPMIPVNKAAPFDEHEAALAEIQPGQQSSFSESKTNNDNNRNDVGRRLSSFNENFNNANAEEEALLDERGSDVPDDEKKVDDSFYSSATTANTAEQQDKDTEEEPGRIIRNSSTSAPTAAAKSKKSLGTKKDLKDIDVENNANTDDESSQPPSLAPKEQESSSTSLPRRIEQFDLTSTEEQPPALEGVAAVSEPSSLSMQMQSIMSKYATTTTATATTKVTAATTTAIQDGGEGEAASNVPVVVPSQKQDTTSNERELEELAVDVVGVHGGPVEDNTSGVTGRSSAVVEDENFELSVMVLPDGQIDSMNPIISASSSSPQEEKTNDGLAGKEDKSMAANLDDRVDQNESIEHTDTGKLSSEKATFREMTPNRDLKNSDKSADWLQEELRRRTVVKQEINEAIINRGMEGGDVDTLNSSCLSIHGPVEVSVESFDRLRDSHSATDDEVAAITAEEGGKDDNWLKPATSREFSSDVQSSANVEDPVPRMLDFGQPNHVNESTELDQFTSSEDMIQLEMRKFAKETRNFLREQSFTQSNEPPVGDSAIHGINENPSMDRSEPKPEPTHFDMDTQSESLKKPVPNTPNSTGSTGKDFVDLKDFEVPVMVESMDSFNGIAKGDIMLSLLSENTGSEEATNGATWGLRVHGAIWRARRMRRSFTHEADSKRGRSSLPVDVDYSRVVGGFRTIASTQDAALLHLQHDEINEAIELVEDIIFAYYSYFEKSLSSREQNSDKAGVGIIDFKPYIGAALHNLGVLNLLRGEYHEALSYFSRSVENRKSQHGEGRPDHVSSLVKLAVCRYALNEFAAAHQAFEEALFHARRTSESLEDRIQVAEILNNLGCLAYMCGNPAAANAFYRDAMDVQFRALSDSLYTGSPILGQSISLNISITRANIGFIKLVTKDLSVSITALENALMEQQILLRGAHDTIIATMDHLAVSRLLNGDQEQASLMFHRILSLQQREYGEQDRRCLVTKDKIKMVNSSGIQYAVAIKELSNTFVMPAESVPENQSFSTTRHPMNSRKGNKEKGHQQNKMLKVLSSMRKKKP
mmetsp:Transcript_45045/g.109505  ORF Transcript_45045/g.109505 Transcript_45045/m.109505 type:complete len:1183 (+) Transcript_45045:24-3572(+)